MARTMPGGLTPFSSPASSRHSPSSVAASPPASSPGSPLSQSQTHLPGRFPLSPAIPRAAPVALKATPARHPPASQGQGQPAYLIRMAHRRARLDAERASVSRWRRGRNVLAYLLIAAVGAVVVAQIPGVAETFGVWVAAPSVRAAPGAATPW